MEELKKLGNDAFSENKFELADDYYTKALFELMGKIVDEENEKVAARFDLDAAVVLHCNRSAALSGLGRFQAALEEAETACRMKKSFAKAHFRRGQANEGLMKWKDAKQAYEVSLNFETKEPVKNAIKAKIASLQPQVEKADSEPALKRISDYVNERNTVIGCPVMLSLSQFEVLELLGEGNYSIVNKVKFKQTGEVFALKIIDKKKADKLSLRHANVQGELRTEKRVMMKLNHENVVKLYLSFQDSTNLYFLSEFCNGQELWAYLKIEFPDLLVEKRRKLFVGEKKTLDYNSKYWSLCGLYSEEAKFYISQLMNAVEYIHQQGIVHRDIKPENVLIITRGNEHWIKLIDFGTARDVFDREEEKEANKEEGDDKRRSFAAKPTHFVGTPEFMSPEAIHGVPADYRSDVWSLGCTIYQLFTGRTPFKGVSDYLTFLKAESGQYKAHSSFSEPMQELLSNTLVPDRKNRRRNVSELKQLAYFSDVNFHQLLKRPFKPFPSLFNLCVKELGSLIWVLAESQCQGPLSKAYPGGATSFAYVHERKHFDCLRSLSKASLDSIMAWLEQRSVLSSPLALQILSSSLSQGDARFERVRNHCFVGYTQQEEGEFTQPYLIAFVGLNESFDVNFDALCDRINSISPLPRLLIVGGGKEASKRVGKDLDFKIAVAHVPSGDEEHYSIWLGGILIIFLNASKQAGGDKPQFDWFERELLIGKMCARNVIVVSSHAWLMGEEEGKKVISKGWREIFLSQMQESNCSLVVFSGGEKEEELVKDRAQGEENRMICKITQVETPSFDRGNCVRIVRVLSNRFLSDVYELGEIPKNFFLDFDEREASDED